MVSEENNNLDDFTSFRYDQLAKGFVEIYITENPLLAAKMLDEEGIKAPHLPAMRDRITQEFLRRGYSFPEAELNVT